MVNVEVEDGYPVYINVFKRCHCTNGNTVKDTKAHGAVYFRMVSRRPDRAEYSGILIG